MIKDEDVIKHTTGKYMKPHERIIYNVALAIGVLFVVGGLVMLVIGLNNDNDGLWITGIVFLGSGILEIIGVAILLWTDGGKKNKAVDVHKDMFEH